MRYLIVILLAGCAPTIWNREGATEKDFNMDRGQCNAQALSVPGATNLQRNAVFDNCMVGKGWRAQRK